MESILGLGGSGDTVMAPPQRDLDIIVESETMEILGEGDAKTEDTTQESTAPSPRREEEQPMEVNTPASPVTRTEDDLLTGATTATATGVETELASLQVTSLPEGEDDHQEASS